jgi:hypothetical protein
MRPPVYIAFARMRLLSSLDLLLWIHEIKSGWDLVEILRLMVWNVAIQDCLRLHT